MTVLGHDELDASRAGVEEEALSAGTGLELDEVRAALARARGRESADDVVASHRVDRGIDA